VEQRIEEVEIKLTLLEHTVDELNAVITRQHALIEQLGARLELLEKRAAAAAENPAATGGGEPLDERPPHY